VPTLSEAESKALLAPRGVPFAVERVVGSAGEAAAAAAEIGYPVVVKLGGAGIAHKTERGLVQLGVSSAADAAEAAAVLLGLARPEDGPVHVLVAEQVRGSRELIAGLVRDPTFGPCVMLGVGGVAAEALGDVAFRRVPLEQVDAEDLIDDLRTQPLLQAFRGEPAVDREALIATLLALGDVGADDRVASVDLNPLVVRAADGRPIAVDALVELRDQT
jgi:acetate---CoA ligase (ADP-forming) subunit beta